MSEYYEDMEEKNQRDIESLESNIEQEREPENSEFDKKYLDSYSEYLFQLKDDESFERQISDMRWNNYLEFLLHLNGYAESAIEVALELIDTTDDILEKKSMKEEISLLRNRLLIVSSKIDEYERMLDEEKKVDSYTGKRELIYLKSLAGNVLPEKDIDLVPGEKLDDLKSAFELLENDNLPSDIKALRGLKATKDFQARVYFCHVIDDVTLVLLIREKKDDWNSKINESVIIRAQKGNEILAKLKKDLKDPVKREEMIREGREITARIIEKIDSKKRGGK